MPDFVLCPGWIITQHVLDGPLHVPTQGVDARVHDQSAGSEHLGPQVTKPHQRITVETKLVPQ